MQGLGSNFADVAVGPKLQMLTQTDDLETREPGAGNRSLRLWWSARSK